MDRESKKEPDRQQLSSSTWDTDAASMRVAVAIRRRQALAGVRRQIKSKVTTEYRETVMNALLVFRGMCGADATEEASRELSLGSAGILKDVLVGQIGEKLREGLEEGLEFGKVLNGYLGAAFDGLKEKLTGIVAAEKRVTALQVVDVVVNGAYEAMETFCEKAGTFVDSISRDQLAAIYRELSKFSGVRDDEDGETEGSIKHGLENWELEEKFGLPRTGGAEVHELAKHYYLVYRAAVRSTMPVREQVDEIRNIGELPIETDLKARAAEEAMGPHMLKSIEKDQRERARVRAL